MSTLLERYIALTMLKATAATLVVLVILLVFFTTIEEFDDIGRGSFAAVDAFLVSVLSAPRYIFEAFPVAALLGSLVGLGAMAGHGELVAMRAAGFSRRQIIAAVMKTGIAMSVAVVLFGELVAPAAERRAEQISIERKQQQVTLQSEYGFWARDGDAFVNIRSIKPGALLEDIYFYELEPGGRLRLVTHAQRVDHEDGHWLMSGISRLEVSRDGVERHQVEQARWDTLLDPDLLNAVVVRPGLLPINELYHYIQVMRANGQSTTDYEVALWLKVATPLATLVMLFIAIPFVLAHQHTVGTGQRVFLGIMLGMVFYTLSRGMSYVALVYDFNPPLSALLPPAVFFVVGLLLLRRTA
jgi:lipopolysaccharide export system permease protein